jgi:hypothetical protein
MQTPLAKNKISTQITQLQLYMKTMVTSNGEIKQEIESQPLISLLM